MNFFAQQERARGQTRRMVILFVIAVIAIVVAVDLVLIVAFGMASESEQSVFQHIAANPALLIVPTLVTLAIIGFSTLYKISVLRKGGSEVAVELGGTLVDSDTTNFAYRRLRNVVEEIAIASGVPVPEVYVLEEEAGINAFAAGFSTSDAVVAVTRGALDKLTRDELQGVIAHEFSHVLNGDMRLNIKLMGVLFGILVIGFIGQKILQHGRGGSRKGGGGILAAALALMIIGYVGVFFGRLIKAGISRQREFLADASAVQFTRLSSGIGGALKKIGGLAVGSKLENAEKEEVSHMLFGDGVGYSRLFATHPPLIERIKAIDPRFDPRELEEIAAAWSEPMQVAESAAGPNASISGFLPNSGVRPAAKPAPSDSPLPRADQELRVSPQGVADQVGNPDKNDYRSAGTIQHTISERLRIAAAMQAAAPDVVLALVLDTESSMRDRQLSLIAKDYDEPRRAAVAAFHNDVANLHPMQRLPLAALAFPALRRQARPALQAFLVTLNHLIHADGKVGLSEYCLAKLIGVQVVDALDPSKSRTMGRRKLPECRDALRDVFALLAREGHDNQAAAQRAFVAGIGQVLSDNPPRYEPPTDWVAALDIALPLLDQLNASGKELLVEGLTRAISDDGSVAVAEAELLRTICAALHCPLPPMLEQKAA